MSEPSFYSCSDDCEQLTCTEPDEAVLEFLDQVEPADWPLTLRVFGWRRTKISAPQAAECAIETLLESLDEEFGDPDGGCADRSAAMMAAANAFVDAVVAEYQKTSWPHEVDYDFALEVTVLDWVRENAPEWLSQEHK